MNRFAHKHAKVEKTDAAKSQADTAEPVPSGEGKCCDARKGLLSVPANMHCAEL